MEELNVRRSREIHLAINTPITLRVSKTFAANLQIKAMVHNSNTSEMARVLMELGSQQLGWDLDNPT